MMSARTVGDLAVARVADLDVPASLRQDLQALLQGSFPGYPDRSYFKLPPQLRYLVTRDEVLLAQLGVELRVIRVGREVLHTFGIVDLCVVESERSHGIATRLLSDVAADAQTRGIDFLLLFADDPRLYTACGFASVTNRCSWLKIHEHETRGLATSESLGGAMMMRPVAGRAWPTGDVDLLGHLF
jgi:GNAT superfamily N-acetyltransferase